MTITDKNTRIIFVFAILILAAVAYGGTFHNGFVWDDETFIVNNPFIHDLSLWPKYFTTADSISNDPGLAQMYRPVQTLSFAIDASIWGNRAGGFHMSSLFLHVACCIAIIFAFSGLIGFIPSAIAACIFAVHPAMSEGVLSLAARGNQLYTLFALVSLGLFLRITRVFDLRHILSILTMLLALFSKEPAVALIAILPLVQTISEQPWNIRTRRPAMLYAPYIIATALFLAARSAVVDTTSARAYWGGSLVSTLQMQSKVFVIYLGLLIWPFNLKGRYTISVPAPFPDPLAIGAVIFNIALVILGIILFRRGIKGKLAALGIAWFYISLAPVSNIVPIPGSMMGERFLYFTFAGLLPLLVGAAQYLEWRRFGKTGIIAVSLVLIAWLVTDISRTKVWTDNRTFFTLLSRQEPDDLAVQTHMSSEEISSGNAQSAVTRLERLIKAERSVSAPPFSKLHYWYGRALLAANRPGDAYREFAVVAKLKPAKDVILLLAEAAARSGDFKTARIILEEEIKSTPDNDTAWNGLGNISLMTGDVPAAISAYRQALAINPDNSEANMNLKALKAE